MALLLSATILIFLVFLSVMVKVLRTRLLSKSYTSLVRNSKMSLMRNAVWIHSVASR